MQPHRRPQRQARIGHRWQRFVLDRDMLNRVLGGRQGVGEDDRDRLAHVTHRPGGEHRMGNRRDLSPLHRIGRRGPDSP